MVMLLYRYCTCHMCMIARGEAIMLALFFSAIPIILPIMLSDFTYYSQNYAWFNVHGISDS